MKVPMSVVMLEIGDPSQLAAVQQAVAHILPPSSIKVFQELPPAAPQTGGNALDELATKIATAIRPNARQSMRQEALRAALGGWDTFWDQEGTPDPALRNAFGAISKAMRAVFPHDASPIDRIVIRRKRFDKDGAYLGTSYHQTQLGLRVRDILKAEGSI
jgi:hypothetical protein